MSVGAPTGDGVIRGAEPADASAVAEQAGRLQVLVAHAVDNGIGWIESLYAQPGCTGQGLGTRLPQQALAELHA